MTTVKNEVRAALNVLRSADIHSRQSLASTVGYAISSLETATELLDEAPTSTEPQTAPQWEPEAVRL